MPMHFETGLHVNSVFWISSLLPGEEGATRRIMEDLEPFFGSIGLPLQFYAPQNAAQLEAALDVITQAAQEGMRPILHFDMHGSRQKGLLIAASEEAISWARLVNRLRKVNIATKNNLCVISAACFGAHAISQLKIMEACPFYMLIAPEDVVTFGFLEDHVCKFYRDLFTSLSFVEPYEEHLAGAMKLFHCEKILATVLSRYIRNGCMGKAGDSRRERLLTEVFQAGIPNTRANRRILRKSVKKMTQPTQALVDRFVTSFLIGKKVNFDTNDLVKLVQSSMGQTAISEDR